MRWTRLVQKAGTALSNRLEQPYPAYGSRLVQYAGAGCQASSMTNGLVITRGALRKTAPELANWVRISTRLYW